MSLHPTIARVTDRIRARSDQTRGPYLERMAKAVSNGPVRAHLSCGNQAHAYAAMGGAKDDLVAVKTPNLGIITAYNDMLSAHQPFETYPEIIRRHMFEQWTDEQRHHQLVKRGRYAEYNLLYDRGTRFGLMTGGNTEAILMSLPPVAIWE